MEDNESGAPKGPHRHPNIRPARGTPNFPEDRGIPESPDFIKTKSPEEERNEFTNYFNTILEQTGLSREIVLKVVALTSNQAPLQSLVKWIDGQHFSQDVTSLFLRQGKRYSRKPHEVAEIAKTEGWI